MKKSLFALAALGAFASAAQAQSSVTLFGTLDSSIGFLNNVQQTMQTTNTPSTVNTTGSGTFFLDSGFATSNWGMRGSEDLGGGMKANFYVEGDLPTNNGVTHNSGLFRRGANVSLADNNLGEVFLGRRGSAYILATGQMLPVSGNIAHQWRTVAGSSLADQISNSVTYATPTLMQTNVVVQYGLNNTIDNGDEGTDFAAHLINKSITNLQLTAAYNNRRSVAATTAALAGAAGAAATGVGGTNAASNREGYAVGLKYKVTPTLEVGTLYAHGRYNNAAGANSAATAGATTGMFGFGVGYQATPMLLLGANYAKSTFGAGMVNLQGHYMLSKRTRVYSQITSVQSTNRTIQLGGYTAGQFSPVNCGSNTTTVCSSALSGSAGAGNVPVNSQGYTVGILHTF